MTITLVKNGPEDVTLMFCSRTHEGIGYFDDYDLLVKELLSILAFPERHDSVSGVNDTPFEFPDQSVIIKKGGSNEN